MTNLTIPKECKLHAITEKQRGRYAFDSVHVVTIDGRTYAEATNGKCLARIPIEGEAKASTLIPADAWKEATKCARRESGTLEIREGDVIARPGNGRGTVLDLEERGDFPPVCEIIKGLDVEGGTVLRINASMLADLASALGAHSGVVTLEIPKPHPDDPGSIGRAVKVTGGGPDRIGIIMPVVS